MGTVDLLCRQLRDIAPDLRGSSDRWLPPLALYRVRRAHISAVFVADENTNLLARFE
jgi:hypothetical protein